MEFYKLTKMIMLQLLHNQKYFHRFLLHLNLLLDSHFFITRILHELGHKFNFYFTFLKKLNSIKRTKQTSIVL